MGPIGQGNPAAIKAQVAMRKQSQVPQNPGAESPKVNLAAKPNPFAARN